MFEKFSNFKKLVAQAGALTGEPGPDGCAGIGMMEGGGRGPTMKAYM